MQQTLLFFILPKNVPNDKNTPTLTHDEIRLDDQK
jgi:hypothetical protein